MAAGKHPLINADYANTIRAKRLPVFPGLVLTCFVRDNIPVSRGPLFVVREIDVKIIRNKNAGVSKANINGTNTTASSTGSKSSATSSFLTEQAIRASVRQAVLNMNLALEPASKHEIQFLKHIGVLGKRAPSCSLLDGNDMSLLLEAFGRSYASSELRNAVSKITRNGDMSSLLPARLDGGVDFADCTNDTQLVVADSNNHVSDDTDNVTTGPLPELKRQLIRKRKLQRLLSDSSNYGSDVSKRAGGNGRTRAVSDSASHARDLQPTSVNPNDELSDSSSTGSGSSNGLDTLLSALSSPTSNRASLIQHNTAPTPTSAPVMTNASAAQYTLHNPIAQRPLLSRHLSGTLSLSPPTASLPILPQFAGVASMYIQRDAYTPQYYTAMSPAVNPDRLNLHSLTPPPAYNMNTGSAAVNVQSESSQPIAQSAADISSAVTGKHDSPATSTLISTKLSTVNASGAVATDDVISPSQSFDGLDAMSSNARSQYISQAAQAERMQRAAEIEQFS